MSFKASLITRWPGASYWPDLPESLRACLFHALLLLLALPTYAANSWPEFRGLTGQGLSSATNVPIAWNATNNVVWQKEIPGEGWSSPVLSKGRIYLTTCVSGNEDRPVSLRTLCLNATDGALLWDREVFQPEAARAKLRHKKNSAASATPVIRGDRLYVHFGHMGTAALDLSGKVLWRQTNVNYSPLHGNGGSPALSSDALIFSCDGTEDPFVIALDANDGHILWKTPRKTPASRLFSFSTPLEIAVDGLPQIISPGSGFVAAYSPTDGREIWKVRYGEGYSLVPRPVFAQGLLFVTTGFDQANLLAINPAGGHGDITQSNVVWTYRKGVPNTPSVLVVDNDVYFVSDGGIATCLDARTGQLCWSERLEGGFSASPVYAEGKVYFQNETGTGFVIKAGRKFELLSRNPLGERSLASYAVTDNALFIRTDKHLWRIGQGRE